MAFCGACGAQMEGRFCGVCGAPVHEMSPQPPVASPAQAYAPQPPQPPQSSAPSFQPPSFAQPQGYPPAPPSPFTTPGYSPQPPAQPPRPAGFGPPQAPFAPPMPAAQPPAPPQFSAPTYDPRPPPAPPAPPPSAPKLAPPTPPLPPVPPKPPPSGSDLLSGARGVSLAPPPPLAARKTLMTKSTALARPVDLTAMVHRHDGVITAGTQIEIGPEDTFYGVVDKQVAFALMSGTRRTPEECEGYWVARGAEGVDLDQSLHLVDGRGDRGDVKITGNMSYEVLDPVKLLISDAHLDDGSLADLVVGATYEVLESALRSGLESEWTLEKLSLGELDDAIRDRCTCERLAPKLLRTHGIATSFVTLQVRCHDLQPNPDRAAPNSPGVVTSISDYPQSREITAHESHVVSRTGDSREMVQLVTTPIERGAMIVVGPDENFCGLSAGRIVAVLRPGSHRVAERIELGLFVSLSPTDAMFGRSFGEMHDFKGGVGSVRVYGGLDVRVLDAAEFVRGLPDPDGFSNEGTLGMIGVGAGEALRVLLRDGLASGEWDLKSIADPAEIEEIGRRVGNAYRALPSRVAGTAVEVKQLNLTCDLGPSRGEGEPVTMHVDPSELEEADATDVVAPNGAAGPTDAEIPVALTYAVGAQVLVMWSDGNRYPGMIHESGAEHCLVMFPNGHQQWVPLVALQPA